MQKQILLCIPTHGLLNGQQVMEELMAQDMEEMDHQAVEMVGTAQAPPATACLATSRGSSSCH